MNQTEKRYLLKRIDGIYKEKCKEIHESCSKKEIRLTNEEALQALSSGDFKVRKEPQKYASSLRDFVIFSKERYSSIDIEKYNKKIKELNCMVDSFKDRIMLGVDGQNFLKELEELSNFK